MGTTARATSLVDARVRRAVRSSEIGQWLTDLREQAGLTKQEAALAAGIQDRSLRRYENDGEVPGGLVLLRLLAAYGVAMSMPPPIEQPLAVNAELASMRHLLEELRDGVALMSAGSEIGRTQVLVRLAESGGPELRAQLREPLLKLARREREAGLLLIEQADLLEAQYR